MSLPYKPKALPREYDAKVVRDSLQDLLTAISAGYKYIQFQTQYAAPDKTIPQMVVDANGTTFDPAGGYGSGLYRLRSDGVTWNKLLEHNAPSVLNPMLLGSVFVQQATPTTKGAAATLTGAEVLGGELVYTGAVANLTLPTGANLDSAITTQVGASLAVDRAFDLSVIDTGAGAVTLVVAAGITSVGSLVVAAGTSGIFRIRKTAADTFVIYRRG